MDVWSEFPTSLICGHLPRTLIDVNGSMSVLAYLHQLGILQELFTQRGPRQCFTANFGTIFPSPLNGVG
jgi:hypothetical protein